MREGGVQDGGQPVPCPKQLVLCDEHGVLRVLGVELVGRRRPADRRLGKRAVRVALCQRAGLQRPDPRIRRTRLLRDFDGGGFAQRGHDRLRIRVGRIWVKAVVTQQAIQRVA